MNLAFQDGTALVDDLRAARARAELQACEASLHANEGTLELLISLASKTRALKGSPRSKLYSIAAGKASIIWY